jgi:hypothetical protein
MSKARVVHSPIIEKILHEVSLETRLKVTNEMRILSYLVDIGCIPDGGWTDEKEKKYGRTLNKFVNQLTKDQIREFKEWEKDGRPGEKRKKLHI